MEKIKKHCFALIIIFSFINIFDYFTTSHILKNGGNELNPIMNYFMGILGVEPAMIIVKTGVILFLILTTYVIKTIKIRKMFRNILLGTNIVYFYSMCAFNLQGLI